MESLQALSTFFGCVLCAVVTAALTCGLQIVIDAVITHAGRHRNSRPTKSMPGGTFQESECDLKKHSILHHNTTGYVKRTALCWMQYWVLVCIGPNTVMQALFMKEVVKEVFDYE